ncbi:uncharacterized protein LOC143876136 [Tasmannia lanceolata]|uniref:uncharacterized protein LOC143876136 n=1 Tax=Tasmannia lanceolata TaxID=3420 RepID=UPI0040646608
MEAFSLSLFPSRIPSKLSYLSQAQHLNPLCAIISTHIQNPRIPSPLRASRRISNYTQEAGLVAEPREWAGVGGFEDDDETDDEDDEDRSLDLLVRFIQNIFRKISRRARKAVRSILPLSISTKLVRFSVNGIIILAFLWILKAFLEVVCTLGTIVFVSILLIRGIWSGVVYIQENRYIKTSRIDNETDGIWTGAQPAA